MRPKKGVRRTGGSRSKSTARARSCVEDRPQAMNVDPAELQKFSELSHRWWDPAGSFRPLHEINPLRLDRIDPRAALAGKRGLDVGCGGGIPFASISPRGGAGPRIDLAGQPPRGGPPSCTGNGGAGRV